MDGTTPEREDGEARGGSGALSRALRRHGRTLAGGLVGAIGGAAYAHFIGCRTGTCAITGNAWIAALFFGFTGAVVGMPGPAAPRDGDTGR